ERAGGWRHSHLLDRGSARFLAGCISENRRALVSERNAPLESSRPGRFSRDSVLSSGHVVGSRNPDDPCGNPGVCALFGGSFSLYPSVAGDEALPAEAYAVCGCFGSASYFSCFSGLCASERRCA